MITDVVAGPAGRKGMGVFALRAFQEGEFIFRRRHGRVVRNSEVPSLSRAEQPHLCELDYDRCAILLPPGCYLNHSCDPNAMRSGVKVFAWRRIRRGDEITIDYRLNAFDGRRSRCYCEGSTCTGTVVSDFFSLTSERQLAYLPHAPVFIQREHRRRERSLP